MTYMTAVFHYMFRDGIYREAERAGGNANNGVTDDRYAMRKELPDLLVSGSQGGWVGDSRDLEWKLPSKCEWMLLVEETSVEFGGWY